MSEVIVKLTSDHIKVKGGEYVRDYPHGEWINTAEPYMSDNIVCSVCGYNSICEYNFCPNCGADMREREGE